jgi:DNA-directed RNA polymerase subunit RPC12/RpoP
MLPGPACSECGADMDYRGQRGRPDGYAIVYECPRCGATDTAEADEEDIQQARHNRRL